MDQFLEVFQWLGLDPALLGVGVLLAIALRYLRGMSRRVNSEATYGLAVAFGLLGAWLKTEGFGKGFALNALALCCVVLIGQKVLEKAAAKVAWLPQDNEWAKPEGGSK